MEKRRTFGQLVARTCFTIVWQFILCILLLYIFPLMGVEIRINGQSSSSGATSIFMNVFSWIYMIVVFYLLTTFHMGRMLRKVKKEMDQVYQSSTWILQKEQDGSDKVDQKETKEMLQSDPGVKKEDLEQEGMAEKGLTLEEFYQTSLDISKMKKRIRQMLESERRQKEDLVLQVAAASHDIKTPLTVIRGNAELLSLSGMEGVSEQYTKDILAADEQLELYVNHLIRYTKTYSEGNEDLTECDIIELADEILKQGELIVQGSSRQDTKEFQNKENRIERNRPEKDGNKVRFSMEISDKIRPGMKTMLHREYVIRAVLDLISNALSYSSGEEKEIRVSLNVEEKLLLIAVWNGDSQVPQDVIEHFGTLFYRGDKARNATGCHFGIGHAFVKRVAKMHGGDAYIENQDSGVNVTISLPLV